MEFDLNPNSQSMQALAYQINPIDRTSNLIESDSTTHMSNTFRISGRNRIEIPPFLLNQMPLGEKCKALNYILCLCLCSDPRSKISSIKGNYLDTYFTLKTIMMNEYNTHNIEHEKSLSFLYLSALKCPYEDSLTTDEWKTIGFTTNNPRNELKEGGYFALLFITYFIKRYKEEYSLIQKENNTLSHSYFNIEKCSITICFYVKLALDGLFDSDECQRCRELCAIKVISIYQFLNLTFFQSRDQNYIFDIIAKVFLNVRDRSLNKNTVTQEKMNIIYKDSFNDIFYNELNIAPDIITETEVSYESSSVGN